ncbi:MAG: Clp1/GlmU family protein [Thaumarchaeota archaeon]|nr:Clp1/GlmU family protein [Candidatus Calditenuaceae archaeon]MDW8187277.1 Clp1/GlmU family protein [Nitrososphaerota archaeon]
MRVELRKGQSLLLKGPASASLESGSAEVFGHRLKRGENVVVKPWKTLPLTSLEDSSFELNLGTGSAYELLDFDPVPDSWKRLADSLGERFRVMVMGRVDAGKTSILLTLLNRTISSCEVFFVDLDVGQGEICPPTTMGYARARSSTYTLYSLRAEAIYAFGFTSPSWYVGRSIEVAEQVLRNLQSAERVLIDVDGWIEGDDALEHKLNLIQKVRPTHVLLLGVGPAQELEGLLTSVGAELIVLERPETVAVRSREERRRAREMRISSVFRDSSVRQLVKNWLRYSTVYSDLYIDDPESYFDEALLDAERHGIDAAIATHDELDVSPNLRRAEVGLLSYVLDDEFRVQALALLKGVARFGNTIRVLTSHKETIKHLKLGAVILSSDYQELHVFRSSERWRSR